LAAAKRLGKEEKGFGTTSCPVHSLNVLTQGAHARRTRLLYQKAFGNNVAIGVIAVSNSDYEPTHWWRYSDGVREVIGESIAYIYARFSLFHQSGKIPGIPTVW